VARIVGVIRIPGEGGHRGDDVRRRRADEQLGHALSLCTMIRVQLDWYEEH
jgi:hypothetical protein